MMKLILPILLLFFGSCNLLNDASVTNPADTGFTTDVGEEPSCSDSRKNGIETDLNCGGDCRPCTDHLSCLRNSDCASESCSEEICSPARCDDGIKNGTESDLDCGGNCDPCGAGLNCVVLRDCVGELCEDSKCLDPACQLRCGGDCPDRCLLGEDCEKDSDCEEGSICDGVGDGTVCIEPSARWQRTISFNASSASNDFYAYVRAGLIEGAADNFIFEQDGQSIPSERAQEDGAFWVYIENVVSGRNTFQIKIRREDLAPTGMWTDHVALVHTPGLSPILAPDVSVAEVVNVRPTPGIFGLAGLFDGSSSYVLTKGEGTEALFPTFTISVWFKSDKIVQEWRPLIGKQFSTSNSDDFTMGILDGILFGCTISICATAAVPVNEWKFAVMTYDGVFIKMYIDGELEDVREGVRQQSTAKHPLTIGGDIDNPDGNVDGFFLGSLDEVRFSANIHTAAAIRLQYLSADPSFFVFEE